MLSLEGSTSGMETQQNKEVTNFVASMNNDDGDVIVDKVPEEEKKRKEKKIRRKKKSKVTDSANGSGSGVENLSGERVSLDQDLYSKLAYVSLNCKVPHEELEACLNSNGMSTKVNIVDTTEQCQDEVANSLTPPKQKGRKKKKKREKNAMQLSSLHSSDMQLGPDQQAHKPQLPNSETRTPGKEVNVHNRTRRMCSHSSNATKESNTFDTYLTASEVMAGLRANSLIKGVIRINQRNYREAYINSPDKDQDILIEGMRNRNRALERDEVAVRLNPESAWKVQGLKVQKTATVVYIFEKCHPRVAVGFLKPLSDQNKNFALLSPKDSRVPRVRIPIAKCPANFLMEPDKYKDIMFLARIEDWQDVRYAVGDIIEEIGIIGDLKSETMALLLENDIDFVPYDTKLYQYFPRSPFQIPEEELHSRCDLRNECIFTIDPQTARDLDDAVSCKELDNGNFKIGVHISDVSYFLTEGTPLDEIVAKRATSTYLVASVVHMLPTELCLMCSLLPGVHKLAFSVFWEISPEAEIVSHYFTRSVICSCAQLSYEHAQMMLENPDKEWTEGELPRIYGKYTPKDLSRIVNHLNRLAIIMRSRRFEGGALRLDQPKLEFSLENGSGLPLEYSVYVNKECHRLIEEFMLLANMTVAKRISTDFPELAFLRCHASPHPYVMTELQKSLEQRGIFLDTTSAGALQASMWRYAGDDLFSQATMMVLNNLCAKPMNQAKYFCAKFKDSEEEFWHYALNVPLYTHFTSPIRRYADVMVHRLLCSCLGYSPKPDWKPEYVQAIAANCNKQKYQAKRVGEQSIDLYLAIYIGLHSPLVEEAVVMDVKDLSFDVIVCSTGQVQRIYTNHLPFPNRVTCRTEDKKVIAQEIEWLPTDQIPFGTLLVVEIFSIITVELIRSPTSLKVETRLLRPSKSGVSFT